MAFYLFFLYNHKNKNTRDRMCFESSGCLYSCPWLACNILLLNRFQCKLNNYTCLLLFSCCLAWLFCDPVDCSTPEQLPKEFLSILPTWNFCVYPPCLSRAHHALFRSTSQLYHYSCWNHNPKLPSWELAPAWLCNASVSWRLSLSPSQQRPVF